MSANGGPPNPPWFKYVDWPNAKCLFRAAAPHSISSICALSRASRSSASISSTMYSGAARFYEVLLKKKKKKIAVASYWLLAVGSQG
jgi:hypothetical protein